jgi:hypothetical protein
MITVLDWDDTLFSTSYVLNYASYNGECSTNDKLFFITSIWNNEFDKNSRIDFFQQNLVNTEECEDFEKKNSKISIDDIVEIGITKYNIDSYCEIENDCKTLEKCCHLKSYRQREKEEFYNIESVVLLLLHTILFCIHSTLIIITAAKKNWITACLTIYPRVCKYIKKHNIPIIYSPEPYDKCESFNTYITETQLSIHSVIIVGDSEIDENFYNALSLQNQLKNIYFYQIHNPLLHEVTIVDNITFLYLLQPLQYIINKIINCYASDNIQEISHKHIHVSTDFSELLYFKDVKLK